MNPHIIIPNKELEKPWTCPRCRKTYMILPSLFKTEDHMCDDLVATQPREAYWFERLRNDDYIVEVCVANWQGDPDQVIETKAPDGTIQQWEKRFEGDLMVFKAPDGYSGGPVGWKYDRRKQRGKMMSMETRARESLSNRVSVVF